MELKKVDGTFNFCESLINGCHVISCGQDSSYIDEKGNVRKKKVVKYNVMKPNGSLVCDIWFDTYKTSPEGEVIFGYEKTASEYERILHLYDLEKVGAKIVPTTTGKMLVNGPSLEEVVADIYKYSYGFINKEGNLVIEPVHDFIEFSTEDSCIVTRVDVLIRYGYFDTVDGHQIAPIKFSKANDFAEGLARVRYMNKYAFIDRNKVMEDTKDNSQYGIPPMDGAVGNFVDGKARVVIGNISTHYIDREGKPTTPPHSMVKRNRNSLFL